MLRCFESCETLTIRNCLFFLHYLYVLKIEIYFKHRRRCFIIRGQLTPFCVSKRIQLFIVLKLRHSLLNIFIHSWFFLGCMGRHNRNIIYQYKYNISCKSNEINTGLHLSSILVLIFSLHTFPNEHLSCIRKWVDRNVPAISVHFVNDSFRKCFW